MNHYKIFPSLLLLVVIVFSQGWGETSKKGSFRGDPQMSGFITPPQKKTKTKFENYTAEVEKGGGKSTILIKNGTQKISNITVEGSVENLQFGDLNKDKKPELFFISTNEKKVHFKAYTVGGDYTNELYMIIPEKYQDFEKAGFKVLNDQMQFSFVYKKEGKPIRKDINYNMVAGEAGFLLKPEGWHPDLLARMTGQYASRDASNVGYYKVMLLSQNDYGEWIVNITVKDLETKAAFCKFEGVGEFIDKDLFVPLNYKKSDLKGTLQIRFLDLNAIVFTEDPNDSNELTAFCNGVGSIAGNFKKTDI